MRDDLNVHLGKTSHTVVDGIPLVWAAPSGRTDACPLALWLPPLSLTKEDTVPFLQELVNAGFVAVSFDPWQHGERGT
jgi:hypothetical protein